MGVIKGDTSSFHRGSFERHLNHAIATLPSCKQVWHPHGLEVKGIDAGLLITAGIV